MQTKPSCLSTRQAYLSNRLWELLTLSFEPPSFALSFLAVWQADQHECWILTERKQNR